MFDDIKHITKNAVGRFVSNIKRTLEKAYSIVRPNNNNIININREQYRRNTKPPQNIDANDVLSKIAELITQNNTYIRR